MDINRIHTQPTDIPSSPISELSSLDSDSETCNTSTSRVHFGPLRSPEKRFMALGHRRHHQSLLVDPQQQPTDTSHRPLCGPYNNHDSSDENQEDDEPAHSRSGTPENIQFSTDEPSSVLATRIMRAHDNPSPPPPLSSFLAEPIHLESLSSDKGSVSHRVDIIPQSSTIDLPQQSHEYPFSFPPPSPSPSPSPSCSLWTQDVTLPALFRNSVNLSPAPVGNTEVTESQDILMSVGLPAIASSPLKVFPIFAPSTSPAPPLHQSDTEPPHTPTNDSTTEHSLPTAIFSVHPEGVARNVGVSSPQLEPNNPASPFLSPGKHLGRRSQSPSRRSTRSRRSVSPFVVNGDNSKSAVAPSTPQTIYTVLDPPSPTRSQKKRRVRTKTSVTAAAPGIFNLDSENGNLAGAVAPDDRKDGHPLIESELTQRLVDSHKQESAKMRTKEREEDGIVLGTVSEEESSHPGQSDSITPVVLAQPMPSAQFIPSRAGSAMGEAAASSSQQPGFPLPTSHPQDASTSATQVSSGPRRANRNGSPVRFASPSRSPVTIQSVDLDDPHRTPARRIPLEQAVAQGQISVQKAMQLASRPPDHLFGSQALFPVRTVMFPFRTEMQSPARRVPVTEATPVKSHGPLSPTRASTKVPGRSAEPKPVQGTRSRPAQCAPVNNQQSTNGNPPLHMKAQSFPPVPKSAPRLPLPFPLAPSEPPLLENTEPHVKPLPQANTHTSSTKSQLRQSPSTSRIPRINMKPYAKPALVAATSTSSRAKEGKPRDTVRRVDLTHGSNAMQLGPVRPTTVSNESSASRSASTSSIPEQPTLASGRVLTEAVSPLKRKRGTEAIGSPVKGRTAGVPHPSSAQQGSTHLSVNNQTVPVKETRAPLSLGKIEELSDPPVPVNLMTAPPLDESHTSELPVMMTKDSFDCSVTSNELPISRHTEHRLNASTLSAATSVKENHAPSITSSTSSILSSTGAEYGQFRRTSRPRKTVNSNGYLEVLAATERPRAQRRKATVTSTTGELDVFSGMSAVALRALTTSNTVKNQTYWTAKLETELIRKEGARPESPSVKVKTIMQRREEEKARQRQERAERRARRSDDAIELDEGPRIFSHRGIAVPDTDSESDEGDDCLIRPLFKHQRGPGDDEDYESPTNADRLAKRARSREEEVGEEKKRVKWDRALSTAVYVDDVRPRTRAHQTTIVVKGCLAKTAKEICLDNLGNLPYADTPLADLVHENIVVKKFVYDNDPEAEPAPVLAPKITRSRSKKSKS